MKKSCWIWLILAILFIVYGICVWATHSGTAFFAVWLFLGVCCLGLSIMAKTGLWKRLPGWLRRTAAVMLLLGGIFFCIVEGFILSCFGAKGQKDLDYIIVLGAQVYEHGPSPVLRFRLDAAYDYLCSNPGTKCIVSGGQGYNEPFSEAEGMADYLEERGIDKNRIILEDQSTSTIENIRFCMDYINEQEDSVGIVSNNFHVFRASGIAKKQGITHAEGIAADTNLLYIPNNMFREFFGVVKDTLLGNMKW